MLHPNPRGPSRSTRAAARTLTVGLALAFAAPAAAQDSAPPRKAAAPMVAVRVGTVHTVAGDPIKDAIIVIRGERIVAVGAADQMDLPPGIKVLEYPDAHAYPGFVDALTDAFASPAALSDGSADAGTPITDGLDPFDKTSQELAASGVTTAYVSSQAAGMWRGLGAVLHLGGTDFTVIQEDRHAVGLRMTTGPKASHPLDRIKMLAAPEGMFKGLKAYQKSKKDHEKALEKYAEEYKAWLDHFREDDDKGGSDKPADKPAENKEGGEAGANPNTGEGRGRRGRRGRPGGTPPGGTPEKTPEKKPEVKPTPEAPKQDPKTPDPKKDAPKAGGDAAKNAGAKDKDAPKRPEYPKPVKEDLAKDTLLQVVNDKRPLRIEARRVDEIRAALLLAREQGVDRLILEHASAGDRIADEIARAGAPVVVTEMLPGSVPATYAPVGEEDMAEGTLPAKLHAAGVTVAIASGGKRQGRHLPLLAAWAAGHGLPVDAAIRAITLTPAEILGVASDVGSLEADKFADIVITSGPLLESSSRIVRVMSKGETVFEAK